MIFSEEVKTISLVNLTIKIIIFSFKFKKNMKKNNNNYLYFFLHFHVCSTLKFSNVYIRFVNMLVVRIYITVYKKLDDLCRILSYSMALLIRWYFIDQVDFIWNVTIKYNNSNHVLKFCEWKSSAVQWNLG